MYSYIVYHTVILMPVLAINKAALHDYAILEELSAGIVLSGAEVKSARNGSVNLKGSYVSIRNSEAWLINAHIGPYKPAGTREHYDPTCSRKLLLTQKEIARLIGKLKEKSLTSVPLKVYTHNNRIKIAIGIARGKVKYEKRELLKKRAVAREIRERFKRSQ